MKCHVLVNRMWTFSMSSSLPRLFVPTLPLGSGGDEASPPPEPEDYVREEELESLTKGQTRLS